MDFNAWGLELFHQHYGEESISESHHGHENVANQPGSSPEQLSQLTGQLSNLGIGRGENHARTAPRTARVPATGAFEAPFSPHGQDFHNASYGGGSLSRMDAQPPGDIPVFEEPDSPLNADLSAHHQASPPRGDTVGPSRQQAPTSGTRGGIIRSLGRRLGLDGSRGDRTAQAATSHAPATSAPPGSGLAHYTDIMDERFLADLARGARISDLDKLSGGSFARGYFKSDGTLLLPATILRNHLDADDRARLDSACATRMVVMQAFDRVGLAGFRNVARRLATAGGTLNDAAAHAGVAADDVRMFFTEEGLTPSGVARFVAVGTAASARIVQHVEQWRQQRAQSPLPAASPSASFFEFAAPGQASADARADWQAYEQEAIWRSLSGQHTPGSLVGPSVEPPALDEPPAPGDDPGASSLTAALPAVATAPGPSHYAEIMALLPDYARGAAIPVLQRNVGDPAATFNVGVYFTPKGGLHPRGIAFRKRLDEADQALVDAAVTARQAELSDEAIAAAARQEHYALRRPAAYDHIMNEDFLGGFASGRQLSELNHPTPGSFLARTYFKSDGTLSKGGVIFRNHLNTADRARFDKACSDRSAVVQAYRSIGRARFKKIAQSLSTGGRTVEAAAAHAGVALSDLRLFLTDDGLTPAGKVCLHKPDLAIWASVARDLERWQQQRQPQRRRTPEHQEQGSPSSSFFRFPTPGPQHGAPDIAQRDYEQEALWNSLTRPAEHASPSASFFDFSVPSPQQGEAGGSPSAYGQDALWNSLMPQRPVDHAGPHAAGPSSSSQPPATSDWEANMAFQAARLGIPFFGVDDVGPEWRGASFVDHRGQPFAYAPDRVAGRLAAMLHTGEIESGDLVMIHGVNYRIAPIGGQSIPTHENPHGIMFALYPH
jgi:hypothetical protein